jgi:DNA-binding response OmpR family regulator
VISDQILADDHCQAETESRGAKALEQLRRDLMLMILMLPRAEKIEWTEGWCARPFDCAQGLP